MVAPSINKIISALKWRWEIYGRMVQFEVGRYFRSIPLNTKKQREHLQPFFIVCAGRSGSTMLRGQLVKSEKVNIPPESGGLLPMLVDLSAGWSCRNWTVFINNSLELFDNIPELAYWNIDKDIAQEKLLSLSKESRTVAQLINSLYQSQSSVTGMCWGDKTPYLNYRLNYLNAIFPKARYIFLVRDGRDVVASALNLDFGSYNLRTAAVRWRDSIRLMERGIRRIPTERVKMVKYEELVRSPEEMLSELFAFLDIPYTPDILSKKVPDMGDTVKNHHQNIFNPINTKSVGKWGSFFNDGQKEELQKIIFDELKRYQYIK